MTQSVECGLLIRCHPQVQCQVSLMCVFFSGMFFQIRDIVLSCPECLCEATKKAEVRRQLHVKNIYILYIYIIYIHTYIYICRLFLDFFSLSFKIWSLLFLRHFTFRLAHLLSHFLILSQSFSGAPKFSFAHFIPLSLSTFAASGAGNQRLCHQDDGIARR